MNSYETAVVVLTVISVISFLINFVMFLKITEMRVHLNQVHASMGSILTRILGLEQITSKLTTGFSEFMDSFGDIIDHLGMMNMNGTHSQLFRTTDGKYSATSLEDLVDKIKKDGKDSEYFKDHSIDDFKNLFEDDDDEDEFLKDK